MTFEPLLRVRLGVFNAFPAVKTDGDAFGVKPGADRFRLHVDPVLDPIFVTDVLRLLLANFVLAKSADVTDRAAAVDRSSFSVAASILNAFAAMTRVERGAIVDVRIDDDAIFAVGRRVKTFEAGAGFLGAASDFEL